MSREKEMKEIGMVVGIVSLGFFKAAVQRGYVETKRVRIGDYVLAEHSHLDALVLCQVTDVRMEDRGYHEQSSLVDTYVETGRRPKVATTLRCFLYITPIGFVEDGEFCPLREALTPSSRVFEAKAEDIEGYFKVAHPECGLNVGNLRDYPVPIQLDGYYSLIMHHLIAGMTGYGKSYYAGITIEEYQEVERPVPQIVVDSHGEYLTMNEKNPDNAEGRSYNVVEYHSEDFPPLPEVMGADELAKQMGLSSGAAKDVLVTAIRAVQVEASSRGFKSSVEFLEAVQARLIEAGAGRREATMQAAESALASFIEKIKGAPSAIREAAKQGQVSVLNLRKESLEGMQAAVANLVNQAYASIVRGEIPPCRIVIDEAALYCPEKIFGVGNYSVPLEAIQRAITQGRKFGLGFAVTTLRPTLIATTVRNLCSTATIFRLTGLDAVEVSDMYGFPELRAILPKLKIGEAMVMGIGAPLDRPVPVKIRKRYSKHGGVGISLEETLLTKSELSKR